MTLEDFLELVDDPAPQGHGDSTRYLCPAHGGHALSVREGDEGLIVACHSGCRIEDVVKALGIGISDLFYNRRASLGEPEAVYVYRDEHGDPLFEAVRYPGKRFRQRHYSPDNPDAKEDGYVYSLDGVRRVLYRLPEFISAPLSQTVYICEGEKDVEALVEAGEQATCNPMGAGKWLEEYSIFLVGRPVVIVVDRDEPGRKHAEKVRNSLRGTAESVRLVQARTGKDAADHLAAGHTPEEFVPVRERAQRGEATPRDLYEMVLGALQTSERGSNHYGNPWGLEEPEFVPGRLYILGAKTAGGKTSAALQVYRDLCERGVRPCYVSMEMSKSDLANRLLAHKGYRLKQLERPWSMPQEWRDEIATAAAEWLEWEGSINFETSADAEYCAGLIDSGEYDFLIFDHLHQIEKVAGGEEGNIAREVRALRNIALDYDIPVLALSQFKRPLQPGQLPTLYDFKGSSAIEQNATMAMALHSTGHLTYDLILLKNRDGPQGAPQPLYFDGPRFSFRSANPTPGGSDDSERGVQRQGWLAPSI